MRPAPAVIAHAGEVVTTAAAATDRRTWTHCRSPPTTCCRWSATARAASITRAWPPSSSAAGALARATSACSGARWAASPATGSCRNCASNRPSGCWRKSACWCAAIGRRYLGWVDPCFNADPRVPGQLAELLLARWHPRRPKRLGAHRRDGPRRSLRRAGQLRALRPERSLSRHRAAGQREPRHPCTRPAAWRMRARPCASCASNFRKCWPSALSSTACPAIRPRTIRAIHRLVSELELDQFFFIPLTPLPGTAEWRPELWDPTGETLSRIQLPPHGPPAWPPRRTGARAALVAADQLAVGARAGLPPPLLRGDARRRRVQWRLAVRGRARPLRRLLHNALGGRR